MTVASKLSVGQKLQSDCDTHCQLLIKFLIVERVEMATPGLAETLPPFSQEQIAYLNAMWSTLSSYQPSGGATTDTAAGSPQVQHEAVAGDADTPPVRYATVYTV